jgi:superfamily I DNA/RNA helicase
VREVTDDTDVDMLEKILPREAFEGVFLVAAGYSLSEARDQLGLRKGESVDTTDFSAAVERPTSQRQFVVITDAAEMEQLLAAPLEQWRVFLHPSQRRLVAMHANGPVRVLGSAGTGKTVVAMHRATWLARHVLQPGQKILFTTFTRNLATDIRANLQKICSREEWERIEVTHLDAWVRRFLDKQGFAIRLTYDDPKSNELWLQAVAMAGEESGFDADFLLSEWDNVIQAHGVESLADYLKVSRVGRSHRLSREERVKVWPVFQEYRSLLSERGLSEPADAFRTAARLIVAGGTELPYRAIIVDEAQDFGNEAFRLLRTIVSPGDNDLFLAGDAHQRIYGHQVVLSRCGIDIRGRGRKLRINYRTTEELKNWASGLLRGMSFDDLDAGLDDMQGIRSLLHGEAPVVLEAANQTVMAENVVRHLKDLIAAGASSESICVVAFSHRQIERLKKYICAEKLPVHVVEPSQADDSSQPGVRLATIHRVKGLEFDHVVLAGIFDPARRGSESLEAHARRLALLYVAATRARTSLCVCRLVSGD